MGASPTATGLAGAKAPEPHSGLGPTDGIPSAGFTPAPWRFREHLPDSQYYGNIIGSYGLNEHGIESIRTITCQLKYGPTEELEANAALIAAAPELFEALEGLIRAVNTPELAAAMACHSVVSFSNVEDALKPALAALRKARGESA